MGIRFTGIGALMALVFALSGSLLAQDLGEVFLQAYQQCKAAERCEDENNPSKSLEYYRAAETTLLKIVRANPKWQPSVVERRLRLAQAAISRLDVQTGGTRRPTPAMSALRPAPQNFDEFPIEDIDIPLPTLDDGDAGFLIGGGLPDPYGMVIPPSPSLARPSLGIGHQPSQFLSQQHIAGTSSVSQDAITQILQQITRLQQSLSASHTDNQKMTLAAQSAESRIRSFRREADNAKVEMVLIRNQLDETRTAMEVLKKDTRQIVRAEVDKETASFLKQLSASEKNVEGLRKENTFLTEKLATATARTKELDKYLAESNLRNEDLQKENKTLTVQLTVANTRIETLTTQVAARDKTIADNTKLFADLNTQLTNLKKNVKVTPETKAVVAENEVLRDIVLRQLQQQSKRNDAGRALEAELAEHNITSDTIRTNIDILASPVVEITDTERNLFKESVALLNDSTSQRITGELVISKAANDIPESLRKDVLRAKGLFDSGKFSNAAEIYRSLVTKQPANYFFLTNLAAAEIESGKNDAAVDTLARAVQVSPTGDSYAHTLQGIALSRQGRDDEARKALDKALTINSADPIAHNYLGLCYARLVDTTTSESHFKKAIEINPNYADAHFNLAILYATAKNPSPDLARHHYKKATELGISPNTELERLIH